MKSFSLFSVVAVVAVVAVAACSNPAPAAPIPVHDKGMRWANIGKSCDDAAPSVLLSPARRDSLPAVFLAPHDQQWADLARSAPGGIGGIFQVGPNFTGDYFVWLTAPTKRAEAIAAIIAKFPGLDEFFPFDRAQVVHGRWDFAQLADWYGYLYLKGPIPGIRSSGIQEGSNRLEFGVPDEAARAALEEWLTALDVPCRLVAIYIQPPIGFW